MDLVKEEEDINIRHRKPEADIIIRRRRIKAEVDKAIRNSVRSINNQEKEVINLIRMLNILVYFVKVKATSLCNAQCQWETDGNWSNEKRGATFVYVMITSKQTARRAGLHVNIVSSRTTPHSTSTGQ